MMKMESRKFALKSPLSLLMFAGRLALWSRNESSPEHLLWLDSTEAAVLLRFSAAPREPAEAAKEVGVEYNSEFERLIDKLVQHRILSEDVTDCDEPFYPLYSPGIKKGDAVCLVESDALGSHLVRDIASGIITSGLVGENPLSPGAFAGTQGFAVKFRRDSLDRLIKLMPWTQPYFDKILDKNVARHFSAGRLENSQPNAFYLNALVIPPGGGTRLHVDVSLDGRTTPSLVSVLYLETVPLGGLLYLCDANWPVGLVNPRPGMIVHFRGDLTHGVTNTPSSSVVRLSLVCEQYCLNEKKIGLCPKLELVIR
jgi:hypothetical protein